MLPIGWNPFKQQEDDIKFAMKSSLYTYEWSWMAVGLKGVIENRKCKSVHVIVNPNLKCSKSKPDYQKAASSSVEYCCFLKTCFLCKKSLSLDKDVYMYKGDQGYCSAECRDRQIYLDEIQELETSTNKILASLRRRCGNPSQCRCTTDTLLFEQEIRQSQHKPLSRSKVIFT
ncbi:hypothetical protein LguiA_028868 [Lonicera macranthoides]